MMSFILQTALPQAELLVERKERIALSEQDSLRVLQALESPAPERQSGESG